MKNILHLLSGGLDSVTLLYDLVRQGNCVHCLLFDYHQRHVQELGFAKLHCHKLGVLWTVIDLPALGMGEEDWVIPFRNPILLTLAVNVAIRGEASEITIGCNQDDRDHFPDCRWEVMDALNHAIKLSGYTIDICSPYLEKTKAEIYKLSCELGINVNEIWTCYQGGSKPCGTCLACLNLKKAIQCA